MVLYLWVRLIELSVERLGIFRKLSGNYFTIDGQLHKQQAFLANGKKGKEEYWPLGSSVSAVLTQKPGVFITMLHCPGPGLSFDTKEAPAKYLRT